MSDRLPDPVLPSPCQEDPSSIRAIDLEFATVYYAAHDLAYAMGGCCIKGAAARRTFVRAYIEELKGKCSIAPSALEESQGRIGFGQPAVSSDSVGSMETALSDLTR